LRRGIRRRRVEFEVIAEIGPLLVNHRFRDRFPTVPMCTGLVKAAVSAASHRLAARVTLQRAADGSRYNKFCSAVITDGHDGKCIRRFRLVQPTYGSYTWSIVFYRRCDQTDLQAMLSSESEGSTIIERVDCHGRHLSDLDFSGRHLRWVRLTGARLENCNFDGATLECVFADFTVIDGTSFRDAFIFESVFAGSRINRSTFAGTTADQCNFNAIQSTECDFSDTSLRGSRFINSRMTMTKFINCDLRHAFFQFSERHEVSFKHSNNDEAFF
jgi:hypothetical protein